MLFQVKGNEKIQRVDVGGACFNAFQTLASWALHRRASDWRVTVLLSLSLFCSEIQINQDPVHKQSITADSYNLALVVEMARFPRARSAEKGLYRWLYQ